MKKTLPANSVSSIRQTAASSKPGKTRRHILPNTAGPCQVCDEYAEPIHMSQSDPFLLCAKCCPICSVPQIPEERTADMTTANSTASRQIQISDWKPYVNTLQGFFTATFPSGMVLHEVMLHQKNEKRWISLPAREWTNQQGVKQYVQWIDFTDKPTRERFQEQVLAALDNHLNNIK